MKTQRRTVLDGEQLQDWIEKVLSPLYPVGSSFYIIPDSPRDMTGESKFMCDVDVDEINIPTAVHLKQAEVKEHTRGSMYHFYVRDCVTLAYALGELTENQLPVLVYYRW